jgi:hypothetical protein
VLNLFDQLIEQQRGRLLKLAEEFIPNITEDDILQPIDYPVLENSPHFRYEEGVLEGLMTARTSFLYALKSGEVAISHEG